MENVSEKMDKTIAKLSQDFSTLRAGRANPSILNKVMVDYYGSSSPIAQVANVSAPEPRTLTIQPWDASILGEVEKAIQTSDLGLTPNNDGTKIVISFPPLTEDRRKELAKEASSMAENAKVSIRGVRRDAMDKAKKEQKNGDMTEDDLKSEEKQIQDITDKKIAEIDQMLAAKSKDITEV